MIALGPSALLARLAARRADRIEAAFMRYRADTSLVGRLGARQAADLRARMPPRAAQNALGGRNGAGRGLAPAATVSRLAPVMARPGAIGERQRPEAAAPVSDTGLRVSPTHGASAPVSGASQP